MSNTYLLGGRTPPTIARRDERTDVGQSQSQQTHSSNSSSGLSFFPPIHEDARSSGRGRRGIHNQRSIPRSNSSARPSTRHEPPTSAASAAIDLISFGMEEEERDLLSTNKHTPRSKSFGSQTTSAFSSTPRNSNVTPAAKRPASASTSSPINGGAVTTSSGLLLTHRKSVSTTTPQKSDLEEIVFNEPQPSVELSHTKYGTSSTRTPYTNPGVSRHKSKPPSTSTSALKNKYAQYTQYYLSGPAYSSSDTNTNNHNSKRKHPKMALMAFATHVWLLVVGLALLAGVLVVLVMHRHEYVTASSVETKKYIQPSLYGSAEPSESSLGVEYRNTQHENTVSSAHQLVQVLVVSEEQMQVLTSHQQQTQTTQHLLTQTKQQAPLPPQNLQQPANMQLNQPQLNNEGTRRKLHTHYHQTQHHRAHNAYRPSNAHPRQHPLAPHFEEWMTTHSKTYPTSDNQHDRFRIWVQNYERTAAKNEVHGPCRLTGRPVFAPNHFADLEPADWQAQMLTYAPPPPLEMRNLHRTGRTQPTDANVMPTRDPYLVNRHPTIQERYLEHTSLTNHIRRLRNHTFHPDFVPIPKDEEQSTTYATNYHQTTATTTGVPTYCGWSISCWLRWLFGSSRRGIREPTYDTSTMPDSVDWREMGVVTDIHSQGNCGACWAITAVETVESAVAIGRGVLYELSENEVIVCDDSCQACYGGWPQNAYEYIVGNGGLPLEGTCAYDGDWLVSITMVEAGESDALDEDTIASYRSSICPSGNNNNNNNGNSGSGSQDQEQNDNSNDDASSSSSSTRYGQIKGYGYSTERCICYSDGSGCDCDSQDEITAIQNVASYGPATICLDASTWMDYAGGIITADSGCGSGFFDMNHCVQAVGYVFTDGQGDEEYDDEVAQQYGENYDQSGSQGSQSNSNSQDSGDREGYWIVRNQWSYYWGMNGYAYVAMGENVCGILNDMTQVYLD